jgi:hypothetical protein
VDEKLTIKSRNERTRRGYGEESETTGGSSGQKSDKMENCTNVKKDDE